jgi:hypothetical protein
MARRKIGVLLLFVTLLLMIAGCSQGNQPGPTNTSPLAHATQSVTSEIEQTPTATQPKIQPVKQPDNLEPEPTSTSPVVVTPSSGASETPQKPGASDTSQTPTPSATPKATHQPEPDKATPAVDSIILSIEGNAEWGMVIADESVILATGDTVADVLKRAAKAHRLAYEIRGSGALTYIRGIDGLYEFDDGPTSGWKFRVNGEVADIGAGAYKLKSGDRVEWFYASEDEEAQAEKENAS